MPTSTLQHLTDFDSSALPSETPIVSHSHSLPSSPPSPPIFQPQPTLSKNNLTVALAPPTDIPALTSLTLQTFSIYPLERDIGNDFTPSNVSAATPRFLRAYDDHLAETGLPSSVKCIHTDPATGEASLAACARWFLFPTPRREEDVVTPNYLATAEWLAEGDEKREIALRAFKPMLELRIKWSRGRGIGILQYMATHEDWRRKGAATMVVRWGLDRCMELGIPAYLECSPTGKLVYGKLGFEVVDEFDEGDNIVPVMMWWPPGTKEEEKKVHPALR